MEEYSKVPPVSEERIDANIFKDTSKVHYIGLMAPPRFGVQLFSTILELTFFEPNTAKNELFEFRIMKWSGPLKANILWMIISIPEDFRPHAKVCMKKAGLRDVRAVPTIFEVPTGIPQNPWAPSIVAVSDLNKLKAHPLTAQARNVTKFPADGNTAFTLEYEDSSHPAYHHPLAFKQLMEIEHQLCNKLHGEIDANVREEDLKAELKKIRDILK